MSRFKSIKFPLLAAVLSALSQIPASASAMPATAGGAVFGAESLTVDIATHLQWLDRPSSAGRSINDMVGMDGRDQFPAATVLCYPASSVLSVESTAGRYLTPALEDRIKLCRGELEY